MNWSITIDAKFSRYPLKLIGIRLLFHPGWLFFRAFLSPGQVSELEIGHSLFNLPGAQTLAAEVILSRLVPGINLKRTQQKKKITKCVILYLNLLLFFFEMNNT